jgi:hypothetical protein
MQSASGDLANLVPDSGVSFFDEKTGNDHKIFLTKIIISLCIDFLSPRKKISALYVQRGDPSLKLRFELTNSNEIRTPIRICNIDF